MFSIDVRMKILLLVVLKFQIIFVLRLLFVVVVVVAVFVLYFVYYKNVFLILGFGSSITISQSKTFLSFFLQKFDIIHFRFLKRCHM